MGRKVSQTSVKISKKAEKKEFNSLISLLRPKVYITDCSSFKTLVQDLTGNGSCSNIAFSNPSSHPQKQQHIVPVVDVEEYQVVEAVEPERSSTTATSFDSSELCNQEMYMYDQELDQLCYQIFSDDTGTTTTTTTTTNISEGYSSPSTADQMVDMFPFQDLESWLSETESFDPSNINGYYGQIDQEVSIFDYELARLL